jgi:hypothetical protein
MIKAVVCKEEWMHPDGSELCDSNPVTLTAYHATGRTSTESVYAEGATGAILGPARYSGASWDAVSTYGSEIEEVTIVLSNPLVIDSEGRLADFGENGLLPGTQDEMRAVAASIRKHVVSMQHDGVIVNVGSGQTNRRGGRTKRLRAMFGQSQVIDQIRSS